jgi:endogenous inhibitor of DNA gyrase (YacG/DUF329 family)
MYACPICQQKAPDIEDADWVYKAQPYCGHECHTIAVAIDLQKLEAGEMPWESPETASLLFHLNGGKEQ